MPEKHSLDYVCAILGFEAVPIFRTLKGMEADLLLFGQLSLFQNILFLFLLVIHCVKLLTVLLVSCIIFPCLVCLSVLRMCKLISLK